MAQGKRLHQLTNIRAMAIFMVVLGHSIILYSSAWNLYETSVSVPFLDMLKKIIDIPQMLLFFSLSGYLFVFSHQKKRGILNLVKSKVMRLLVPFLGVGVFWLLPMRLLIHYPGYEGLTIQTFAVKLMTINDVGHLWFLPALFFVFLLSEVILTIAEKIPGVKKYPEVFLCLVAFALHLEGYWIGFGYAPLLSAYNYLLWFSLGYALHIWKDMLKKIYALAPLKWALILVNLVLIGYCVTADSMRLTLSLLMKGLCIINAYGAVPDKTCEIVERIDRNSFGIYLFHSPLIYITYATIPDASPFIVVFLNLVVFGAAAYGLSELVRRTKWKALIGE